MVRPVAQNCRSHWSLPVSAANDRTCSRSCDTPLEQVTITCPATTIALDVPLPGSAAFQATFSFSLQCVGSPPLSAMPLRLLPRNCRQSPAFADEHTRTRLQMNTDKRGSNIE